jgi:predicted DNA-binding transcriptional regulator AlpA
MQHHQSNATVLDTSGHRDRLRRWMRTEAAADYTGHGKSTLDKLRITGGGPRYVKRGSVVLYDIADLDRWLEERKVRSTSERVRVA